MYNYADFSLGAQCRKVQKAYNHLHSNFILYFIIFYLKYIIKDKYVQSMDKL